jgi:hypothetical protein
MTRKSEPTVDEEDDWAEDDLNLSTADLADAGGATSSVSSMGRISWRMIEELQEQRLLRSHLEDFDQYVV